MTVLRDRRKQRAGRRPKSPIIVAIRKPSTLRVGRHSRYPDPVAGRKIDRDAWARVLAALIDSETRGKKAPFARLVGVDPKTVDNWLKGTVDVTEESVRRVARSTGQSPMDLLVQLGYYRADEVNTPEPAPAQEDEEIQLIADSDLPPHLKRQMIDRLLEMREQDRQRREQTLRWMIDQARGA